MSGTNAAAAKARLVGENGLLHGLAGLDGVEIHYSTPPGEASREYIRGGPVEGPVVLSAMRGGGRLKREENLSLQLEIRVLHMGERTPELADERACEIAKIVIEWIAANPTLGDLPDLKKATVDNFELHGGSEIEAAMSIVTLSVGLMSFLT